MSLSPTSTADAKYKFAGNPRRFAAHLRRMAKERFVKARRAEKQYAARLRSVARQVGALVNGFSVRGHVVDPGGLQDALRRYAVTLQPWARAVAQRMLEDVSARDLSAWAEASTELGKNLRREVAEAPTGEALRARLNEQVVLITSLPLEAAERVHALTTEALSATATRAKVIVKEIAASGEVTKSRAMLIARTEVSRTATTLTEARAQHAGSTGYIWRTSGDSDVRPDHKKLNGRFFRWDDPPVADQRTGARAHAGSIYNCRCYPEPVFPE